MPALTNEQITAWLNDPSAIRGTLIEVQVQPNGSSSNITRYLSTFNYTTGNSDVPANTAYDAIVIGGLRYTEKMDLNNSSSLSVGDIELINTNGELDSWLLDVWVNRSIKAYLGDPRWPRDQFFLIFDGIIADIDSRSLNTINIKIRDKLQRLNTPILELKYSDVAPYPDSSNVTPVNDPLDPNSTIPEVFLPCSFGEQFNITPVLIDPGNLVYMVNYGSVQDIPEVRDNGVPLGPLGFTKNLTKGTFKLNYQPSGAITCSVQGDNVSQTWDVFQPGTTYRNTIPSIIKRLVTGYGKTVPDPVTGAPTLNPSPERFNYNIDIDLTNFSAFETAHPDPVGFYSTNRDNLLGVCQQLASSVGASICMSRLGKLKILQLNSPPIGTPKIITESDFVSNSVQITGKTDIKGSIKLGFNKNYTVQQGLLTNIPYEHKKIYAEDYQTIVKSDYATIYKYNLTGYPQQDNVLLITQPEAYSEALRRLNIYKEPHFTYRFTGFSQLLDLQLGDTIQLVYYRFGFTGDPGVGLGTVISLQPNWATGKVEVEVFI